MPLRPPFPDNPHQRQWRRQVISLLAVFGLLALGVWWYYSVKISQLEQRIAEPMSPIPVTL